MNLNPLFPNIETLTKNDSKISRSFIKNSKNNRRCTAEPKTDMHCCWPGDVCGIGEGDCDFDVDCEAGLKCGHDNCYHDFRTTDIRNNWDVMADCCYGNHFSILNVHNERESIANTFSFRLC